MAEYIEREAAINAACDALELSQSECDAISDSINKVKAADVVDARWMDLGKDTKGRKSKVFVAKKNRICDVCKRKYTPASSTQRYCKDCAETAKSMREKERRERLKAEKARKKKPDMSWAEIVRICNAYGLSYGQARAKGLLDSKESG